MISEKNKWRMWLISGEQFWAAQTLEKCLDVKKPAVHTTVFTLGLSRWSYMLLFDVLVQKKAQRKKTCCLNDYYS